MKDRILVAARDKENKDLLGIENIDKTAIEKIV